MESARTQAWVAIVLGIIAGAVVAVTYRASIGPLAGYDLAVLLYISSVWAIVWPMDAAGTAGLAGPEDPTRTAADVLLLVAAVGSLGLISWAIVESHNSHGSLRGIEIGMGAGSIIVSWLLVQTIFTLKYARLYYRADGEGGINFQHEVRPRYSDFAYVAFTVGMTFQLSDTDLQSSDFRRLVLRHALLSYLFGAVILAATINLVAGLAT